MTRFKAIAACVAVIAVSGCASVLERSTQMVRVETPGVIGARCLLETEAHRYQVITPANVKIQRSRKNMTVTCHAQGYQTAAKFVEPHINSTVFYNVTNAGVGALYDMESGASHEYPSLITVAMMKEVIPYIPAEETVIDNRTFDDFDTVVVPSDNAFKDNDAEKAFNETVNK